MILIVCAVTISVPSLFVTVVEVDVIFVVVFFIKVGVPTDDVESSVMFGSNLGKKNEKKKMVGKIKIVVKQEE